LFREGHGLFGFILAAQLILHLLTRLTCHWACSTPLF